MFTLLKCTDREIYLNQLPYMYTEIQVLSVNQVQCVFCLNFQSKFSAISNIFHNYKFWQDDIIFLNSMTYI